MSTPELSDSTFRKYNLSPDEYLQGCIFNQSQLRVLQNELSQVAENRLNVDYNPRSPMEFVQNEAFLKGQIAILRLVMLRSVESEQEVLARASAASQGNSSQSI